MSGPPNFATPTNFISLSGFAPIGVRTIEVNGIAWPITWTTLTNWTLRMPLSAAVNQLTVLGRDGRGQFVAAVSNQVTVTYTGPVPQPQGSVVINEIMYSPLVAEAEYIEFFNVSTNITFDLSGWRVNGLDYTFPGGSFIGPRGFLVLAKNRSAFASAYGNPFLVFDEFDGDFQRDGETISLIKPGGSPALDLIVDRVRYEGALPWPAVAADGTGSSYRLIDSNQDNSRAGNWAAFHVPAVLTPPIITPGGPRDGWRFFSVSGNIGSGDGNGTMRLLLYIDSPGSALIDDVSIVAGTNAEVGFNHVANGDFEIAVDRWADELLAHRNELLRRFADRE